MSTERQIVEKFKEALETKDMGIVSPHLAEGATVEILPSTVGGKMTCAVWISKLAEKIKESPSVKFDLTNVIEHPLFALFQANFSVAFPTGPFDQDVMFIFRYTKDASGSLKIASVVEYVDSFKMTELKEKMGGNF